MKRQAPRRQERPKNGAASPVTTRDRILAAAARLFAEQGFANASMPAIARLSGITAGAIYRHFDSKAELLLEVVKHALHSFPLSVQIRARGETGADVLPRLAASYTDRRFKLTRQLSLEVHAAAGREDDVRALLSDYDERATRAIRDIIAAAQRGKKLDSKLDPDFTARILTAVIMGLNHMDTLHPQLVGDRTWRDFVARRVAVLIGLP